MKGSLILEKVNNRAIREEWEKRLVKLNKALKRLVEARYTKDDVLSKMEYIAAVLEFAEARERFDTVLKLTRPSPGSRGRSVDGQSLILERYSPIKSPTIRHYLGSGL